MPDNPFLAFEHMASDMIANGLEVWGKARDAMSEPIFLNTYGSPLAAGDDGPACRSAPRAGRRIERDLAREAAASQQAAELAQQIEQGGLAEAAVRALIYVRLPEGKVDERGLAALRGRSAASCRPPSVSGSRVSRKWSEKQYLILAAGRGAGDRGDSEAACRTTAGSARRR